MGGVILGWCRYAKAGRFQASALEEAGFARRQWVRVRRRTGSGPADVSREGSSIIHQQLINGGPANPRGVQAPRVSSLGSPTNRHPVELMPKGYVHSGGNS